MALRFKKASCVVVGTFNIYVVQPRLLAQLGLIPFGEPALVEQNLTQAGFRFVIESLQSQWTVRPDKLIVETSEPLKDCGGDLSKVISALQFTPVTGVGLNVEFEGEPELCRESIPEFAVPNETQIVQRTVHVALNKLGRTYNFQIASTNLATELSVNVHCELDGQDQSASIACATQLLREFLSIREEIESLSEELFKMRFADVNNHDH